MRQPVWMIGVALLSLIHIGFAIAMRQGWALPFVVQVSWYGIAIVLGALLGQAMSMLPAASSVSGAVVASTLPFLLVLRLWNPEHVADFSLLKGLKLMAGMGMLGFGAGLVGF